MKAHRVLGGDEVETPLRPSLQLARLGQLGVGRSRGLGGGDGIELVHQGGAGTLQKSVVALLDAVDAGQHLNLRHAVARLAGAVHIQQRAAHPVV
ncbi:MAG: hypothetical protein VCF24_08985 [Candidatus Latescibacterota bacterium]